MPKLMLLSIVLLLVIAPIAAHAAEVEVQSRVGKVTVYQHSAEVVRSGTARLQSGRNTLVFSGIPDRLNPDSMRVGGSGLGRITIGSVEFKTRYLKEEFSPEAKALDDKIRGVERQIAALRASKDRIESQKKLLSEIALDTSTPTDKGEMLRPRSAQEMSQVLSFISDSGSRLDNELLELNTKLENMERELQALRQERTSLQPSQKSESVVEVLVDAQGAAEVNLELSYQVPGASWRPAYNLHSDSNEKGETFKLETYALVRQSTGEAWKDVELILSTAQAHIGLNRPHPVSRAVDIAPPIAPIAPAGRSKSAVMRGGADIAGELEGAVMNMQAAAMAPQEAAPLEEQTAEVSRLGVSVFKLPGKVSLASDGSQEKLKLNVSELKGRVTNVAVPALQSHVYREAIVTNSSEAPLLPGLISVFSDGIFVGKHMLQFTQPDKEMRLPVGLSDELVITRRQTRRFEDDSGLVRSIRRLSSAWEIEIENLSGREQEIVVLEPGTVSRNEKIKVTLAKIEPAVLDAKSEDRLEKGEGILEWHLKVPAKNKKKISYEHQVEFEAGLNVIGVEGF